MALKTPEEVRTPTDVLRSPADVFRTPKRHEGEIVAGRPDPAYRAFELLYIAFIVTPILAGLSKFSPFLANWPVHLAPMAKGAAAMGFLHGMGILEIILGLVVAMSPRVGGWAAAIWLWLGIVDLLLIPGYYGLMLCLAVMSLSALALSFLAKEYRGRSNWRNV